MFFLTKRVEELEAEGNKNMATFEQNTNETIEKIVRNLDTITNSIVDLYGKIEELNKSVERIEKLTATEEKESQSEFNYEVCYFCGGSGVVMVDDYIGGSYAKACPDCRGTGKIKIKGDV